MTDKSFSRCTLEFLDTEFNLMQVTTLPLLEEWLNVPSDVSDIEKFALLDLQESLRFNVHDWNEAELTTNFIGPLFQKLKIFSQKYNFYSIREVEGVTVGNTGDWRLFGKPDGMIAGGRRSPKKPYFMFNEYKKDTDSEGDPVGQALSAMLVGQVINEKKRPIFGCYVIGQSWNFIVLEGNEYAISATYSALRPDIFLIFNILKKLKTYIEQFVEEDA